MERRRFLRHIPGLGIFFLEMKQTFGRTFSKFFWFQQVNSLTIYPADRSTSTSIPIWWKYQHAYVSVLELTNALHYRTYENRRKHKLVIYFPQNKVVVIGENPFLLIDNKTFQMPLETLWHDDQIYLPLAYFIPLINQYTSGTWEYDELQQILRESRSRYSVTGIEVSSKENGVVIRIRTTREFKKGEMSIDMRYNWFHVDLYGATGNPQALKQTKVGGKVREIRVFPFEQLLSIGFRLSQDPLSKEIYQDQNSKDIVVVLRYKEEISQANIARDDDPYSLDMQKRLESEKKRWLIDTVIIDAGHGGKDPGAIGAGKLREKEVVLSIALRLGELIESRMPNVNIVYTRTGDQFVELRQRTQIANENHGKVFISIHANANHNKSARGFETYILGPEKGERAREVVERENAVIEFEDPGSQRHYEGINRILASLAQSAFLKQSEHLASRVQNALDSRLNGLDMKSRGVKQAPFWVMVGASMPCILVETGFITNSSDAKILKTGAYQQRLAEGIFSGLERFKEDYESTI